MDNLKLFITIFLITISLSIYMGNSADLDLGGLMLAGGGGSGQALPCLPKLLPCQQFLGSDKEPTSACCGPLKEIFQQETKCLCDAFQNPSMLAAINVTKDDILKLPKACGLDANEDVCKSISNNPSASSGTNNSTSADAKAVDSPGSPSTDKSSNSDSNFAAQGIAYLSGCSITALVVALIV